MKTESINDAMKRIWNKEKVENDLLKAQEIAEASIGMLELIPREQYDSNSYYHDTEPCRELTDTEWAALGRTLAKLDPISRAQLAEGHWIQDSSGLSDRLLRRTALRSARVGLDIAIRTWGLSCN